MRRATLLLLLSACGSDSKVSGTSGPPAFTHAALVAWQAAGLTVSVFAADVGKKVGDRCFIGTVNGIDVALCSGDGGKANEDRALAWIGDATGSVQLHDKWQLVVADRSKADPNGHTINRITQGFRPKAKTRE